MTLLEALQETLAGEHAAIYVYGVLGGRVSAAAEPATGAAVTAAYITHRARRDQLELMIRELGAEPVAAEVAYDLSGGALTTPQIASEANGIEARSAEVYAQLVASTAGTQRQWAIDALTDSAVRRLGFGAEPEAFPGLAEL